MPKLSFSLRSASIGLLLAFGSFVAFEGFERVGAWISWLTSPRASASPPPSKRLQQSRLHPWKASPSHSSPHVALLHRIPPPPHTKRKPFRRGSFAWWLRRLPLLPTDAPVHLFDGRLKPRQDVHAAVIDIDIGSKDLQQCADAVMRLWGEFLWSRGSPSFFDVRLGDKAHPWTRWAQGDRLLLRGQSLRWLRKRSPADPSYASFRRYLWHTMAWANTTSLKKQLRSLPIHEARPGDLLLVGWKGGKPGHAVLLLDQASDAKGQSFFLLGQSYMPAQNFHLLRAPGQATSPWFRFPTQGTIHTPEWDFTTDDLHRLPDPPASSTP